ncbi:uncharacterized protein LOC127529021 [Erpetoichthys calabaricus]|uniref:uncharacterized protein LOC127529021 n=1 Tax=Erpetoichthys calabaricus TaxID=27687 RepID=UPI00223417FF|nr:uncharacterized protein LOC127529021 [Erpetoichthys calabaricus]
MYVKEEDILEFIQPIQCRKLLNAWKHHEQESSILAEQFVQPSSPLHSPQTSSSGSSVSSMGYSASSTSVSPVFVTWPETFQVPWDSLPTGIQMAIAKCQRPSPADRRQIIRVLADEIRTHESNPTRSQFLIVVRQIVKQYPKSFADMIGDKQIAGGYASLLSQLKVNIEHLNRSNTLSHHRIQSNESGTIKKRSTTDSYGCTRWQPELTAGESYDSLEVKRQRMEEIFLHEGSTGADRGEVRKLMEETYCYQHRMINAIPSPTIANLKTKWPYLFIQRYMYSHFELLTDRNVLSHLEMSFKECGKLITEYFKTKPTNAIVQNVLTRGEEDVAACVLQLLLAHFEEKMDGLILQADAFATSADIQGTLNLPGSPRLIIFGQTLSNQRWMVSIEGRVVCEGTQPSFVSGLAAVFASYYNFNLQYQEEAACTLEFVQRRFIDINPERGSKTKQGKLISKKTGQVVQKKKSTVNPHVSSLLSKLMDFEWNFV